MAAVKRKGRKKNNRRSIFCFFGGCFGISTKVSADHGDGKLGKLVKHGNKGKTAPVNDQAFPMSMSSEIICSSREIHVVDAEGGSTQLPAAPIHEVIDNKIQEMIPEKSKKLEESSGAPKIIGQETWTKPTKLSHSASLPLLPHKKENLMGKRGKKDKELITAGEFDSILGALIILITLTVMLIWGKVCAILCTAAWLYLIPRVRANIDEDYAINLRNGKNYYVDLDSKEYKKKVVLQGLLDRNHHHL